MHMFLKVQCGFLICILLIFMCNPLKIQPSSKRNSSPAESTYSLSHGNHQAGFLRIKSPKKKKVFPFLPSTTTTTINQIQHANQNDDIDATAQSHTDLPSSFALYTHAHRNESANPDEGRREPAIECVKNGRILGTMTMTDGRDEGMLADEPAGPNPVTVIKGVASV